MKKILSILLMAMGFAAFSGDSVSGKLTPQKQNEPIWYWLKKESITPEEARILTSSALPSGLIPLKAILSETADFDQIVGGKRVLRRPVLLLCTIESDREKEVIASAGADYFFVVFCNGKLCISTLEHGNPGTPVSSDDRVFRIPLRKGKNILGFYVQSGTGGWKGGFRFLPETPENLRRISRNEMIRAAFPAKAALRYGPWITYSENDRAAIRFTTEGNLAVCVDYREKNTGAYRRHYELWNGHFRDDTDRHMVVLTDLLPDREYEFRIGIIPKVKVSNGHLPLPQKVEILPGKYTFRTLPSPGKSTRFFAVSDTHLPRKMRLDVLAEGEKRFGISRGDFMLHLGDISSSISCFDDDILGGYCEFFNRKNRLTPLVTVHGNHEYSGDENALWNSAFASPSGENYYAFRSGDCFIVVLSFFSGGKIAEEIPSNLGNHQRRQQEWIESLMKSQEFQSAKYRILCNHYPPVYNTNRGERVQSAVYEVLDRPGKNPWTLMLCGHVHRNNRTTVGGVPVLWLGGGECLEKISFAEVQSTPEGLRVRSWTGDGKQICEFTVPPPKEKKK